MEYKQISCCRYRNLDYIFGYIIIYVTFVIQNRIKYKIIRENICILFIDIRTKRTKVIGYSYLFMKNIYEYSILLLIIKDTKKFFSFLS